MALDASVACNGNHCCRLFNCNKSHRLYPGPRDIALAAADWRFVIINDRDILANVAQASCIRSFIKNPPCIIAACADTDLHVMKCGQLSYPIDVAIALDHLSLSAVGLGLGTCWIGIFDEIKVKKILGIPGKIRVVALMVLGYPANPAAEEKKRLSLKQIVKYNRW